MRRVLLVAFALTAVGCKKDEPASTDEAPQIIDGASVVATAPTSAADLQAGRYQLHAGEAGGPCLATEGDGGLGAATCDADQPAQLWFFVSNGDGTWRVEAGGNGDVLDISGGGTEAGTEVGTWGWGEGADNRRFRVQDAGGGAVELASVSAPGQCVALATSGRIELAECGTPEARWWLFAVTQSPTIGRGLSSEGCVAAPVLSVTPVEERTIAALGRPFPANTEDLVEPGSHGSNYGKSPEVVAIPSGTGLDVLVRDQDAPGAGYVVHLEPSADGLAVAAAWRVGLLDSVMGLTLDEEGVRYYATGIDEGDVITASVPAPGERRSGIVRVVGFDEAGCVRLEVDLDLARAYRDGGSEAIINPLTASTSRLAYGDGALALLHGVNTDADDAGTRHQKAMTTHVSVASGEVLRTGSQWVSHSFDQRLYWEPGGFVEAHLGDTYPRGIVLGRFTPTDGAGGYLPFRPKGSGNATYTELGGVAPVTDADYGYLVVFTTERSGEVVEGDTRDLAVVRVKRDVWALDQEAEPIVDPTASEQTVPGSEPAITNRLTWLTDYATTDGPGVHASRPRVVEVGDDQLVVLWERWTAEGFDGTWAMTLNGVGEVTAPAMRIGDDHIPRGEDAVRLGQEAAVVIGDGATLAVTLVDAALQTRRIVVP